MRAGSGCERNVQPSVQPTAEVVATGWLLYRLYNRRGGCQDVESYGGMYSLALKFEREGNSNDLKGDEEPIDTSCIKSGFRSHAHPKIQRDMIEFTRWNCAPTGSGKSPSLKSLISPSLREQHKIHRCCEDRLGKHKPQFLK